MSYPVGVWFDLSQTFWFYKKEVEVINHAGEKKRYRLILPDSSDFPLVDQLFRDKVVRRTLKQGCCPTLTDKGIVLSPESKHAKLLELCSKVEGLEDEDKVLLRGFEAMLGKGQYGLAGDSIKILYETSPQTALLELYAEFLKMMKDTQASLMFMELYRRNKVRSDFLIDALLADPNNKEACEQLETFARTPTAWMHLYLYIHVRTRSELFLKKASRIDTKSPLPFLAQVSCAKTKEEKREAYAKLADLYTELGEKGLARYYRSKNPEVFFTHSATNRLFPKAEETPIRVQSMLGRVPVISRIIEMRQQNHHLEEEEEPIYESKGIKREYLDYIDRALKNKDWENPVQIIQELIHSAVAEKGLTVGSFYKRCLALCQEPGRRDVFLRKLWEIYTSSNKLQKATVIYRLYQSDFEEIDRHLEMTAFLMQKGLWIREMGTTLFALVQHSIQSNQYDKGLKCLWLLYQHDMKIFSHHEQIQIFLMRKIIETKIDVKGLQDVIPASLKLQDPALSGLKQVRKRGITLRLDHPTFFCCYVDPSHRYLFTKRRVEVVSSKNKSMMDYPLKLVQPSGMLVSTKLSSKKTIEWLLDQGFSPVIRESEVTFVQLTDRDFCQPLITECGAFTRSRNRRDNLQALLLTVQASLTHELYSVAISYLQRAYNMSRNTQDEAKVKELYDATQALKLPTVIPFEVVDRSTDPRTEWIEKCSQLSTELNDIHFEVAASLRSSKLYFELGIHFLCNQIIETALQSCAGAPYEARVRDLCERLRTLDETAPESMQTVLEDKSSLSEEVFETLVNLSQIPSSDKEMREKLYQKLAELEPKNRAFYEKKMVEDPALKQNKQKLLVEEVHAKELLQKYKSQDKLEKALHVAVFLHDWYKNFEMSMELAEGLLFDDKISEGLNIYFEIALEAVRTYKFPNLEKCVEALLPHNDLLDKSQKDLLHLLNILVK